MSVGEGINEQTDRLIQDLDRTFVEPMLTDALADAKVYNEWIAEDDSLSAEQRREIIESLDGKVQPFIQTQALVTGFFRSEDPHTGGLREDFLEDAQVTFNGFWIPSDETLETLESVTSTRPVRGVAFHILAPAQVLYQDLDEEDQEKQLTLVGSMELDTAIIEFHKMSFERAVAWLTNMYPDIIDEIDSLVLGAEVESEAELLDYLAGYELGPIENSADEAMVQKCAQIYLNEVLKLDQEVPYSCILEGDGLVEQGEGNFVAATLSTNGKSKLISLEYFQFFKVTDEEGQTTFPLYIKIKQVLEDHSTQGLQMFLPVETIRNAVSVRHAYYSE